jgi:outer membrane protein insertion porin family
MVNRLARTGVHVEYRAVSLLVDIRLHRKFFGNLEHLADERIVFRHQVIQCRNVLLGHDQEMDRSLRPKILECHHEVVFMHKVCGCIAFDDPAKKTRLLHGLNLALLGVLLCTTLLAGAKPLQNPTPTDTSTVKRTELLSYEGQTVSSVELAGRPDLNGDEFTRLIAQRAGEKFSADKIDQSIIALQRTGQFQDIQVDLRPELDGVRVVFIPQPAVYFGMYQFPGAEQFPYARLLQVSSYVPQEPYSAVDIRKAQEALARFLQRNGYFEADVQPNVQTDKPNGLANVNFKVTLKRQAKFGDISISGTTPDETEHLKVILHSLRARMKMSAVRAGKGYSLRTLQRAVSYLEGRLQSENHLAAQVKLIGANYNPQTNRADISFEVHTGPIVHAQVEGAHLWPWTKHKLLPIYQQNGLAPEMIQEGRQNLIKEFRQKGYFDVEVATETQVHPNGVTVFYRVIKGDRKKIEDVAFAGNQHFDKAELMQHVNVKKAGIISKGSYNENSLKTLQAFYQSKGFNQVKVAPQFNAKDKNIIVTFAINEGPQDIVDSIRIEGNNSMQLNQLAPDGLSIGPGQPYAQKSVADDRNKIMSHYLEEGYLTATFHATAQPLPSDPHKFEVVYEIAEGPQVKTGNIITVGTKVSKQALIDKQISMLKTGGPLAESNILESEGRLYTTGVFDWADVNSRRPIASQETEDVIVKVHESRRNTITYGFGYEYVNRGGSVPSGTVALPGLPAVGLPSTFQTSQQSFQGPRANFEFTRNNVRGKAETITIGGLAGVLDRRASFVFTDPNFRWTDWTASLTTTGEYDKQNPIFTSRQGQFGFQLQRALNPKKTQNLFLRYTVTQLGLTNLLIPDLVPHEDLHTRLSTLAAVFIRDTRDNPLDAHKGHYDSLEFDVNPALLGSSVNFGKLLGQAAYYKSLGKIVWANSFRVGLETASSGSHVPISQKFFTGGGSTLRGFPLNGAGPQRTIPACGNPSDPSTCVMIRVPTGGSGLGILNSELRIPLPIMKGLSLVPFYDGGNVFDRLSFSNFSQNYTNSVGLGLRYATPVGPIRVDLGHNLSPIPGIKATQIFITLGQAF